MKNLNFLFCSVTILSAAVVSSPAFAIIGGSDATGDEAFAASTVLLMNTSGEKTKPVCTAVIVAEDLALTAAHCIDPEPMGLLFGTKFTSSPSASHRAVSAHRISPMYDGMERGFHANMGDLAILKFAGGIPEGFRAAKLLAERSLLRAGGTVLLAGFGVTGRTNFASAGVLRSVETTIIDPEASETEVEIEQRNGKGSCLGDSGGPAFATVDGELLLWGISHGGVGTAKNCLESSAYTVITAHRSWLKQVIEEWRGLER